MDEVFRHALYGIAAELQLLAFEADADSLYEADLRSATRRALQIHLGQKVVIEAKASLPNWKAKTGRFDIGVRKQSGNGYDALAELKLWRDKGKSAEAAWDAWKLASAYRHELAWNVYLIAAGKESLWGEYPGTELFSDGVAKAAESWSRYQAWFDQWTTPTSGPINLPAGLKTHALERIPIHVADGEPWLVACARVTTTPGPPWAVPG